MAFLAAKFDASNAAVLPKDTLRELSAVIASDAQLQSKCKLVMSYAAERVNAVNSKGISAVQPRCVVVQL